MKNLLTLCFLILAVACHGAGLTVASTNGSAVRLTSTGTTLAGTTTNAAGNVMVMPNGDILGRGFYGENYTLDTDFIQMIPGFIRLLTDGTNYLYGHLTVQNSGEMTTSFEIGSEYMFLFNVGGIPKITFERFTGNQTNTGTIKAAEFVGGGGQLTGVISTAEDSRQFTTNLFSGLLFPMSTNQVGTITTATNLYFTGLDYSSSLNGRWGELVVKAALNSNIIITNPPEWFTSDAQKSRNLFSNQVMVISVEAIPGFLTNASFGIFQ